MGPGPSFTELLDLHRRLLDRFLEHQLLLVDRDLPAARAALDGFAEALRRHARDEEELLLPIYGSRADPPAGGSVELFVGEHRKMSEALDRIASMLERTGDDPRRRIVEILEEEARFKSLLDHHDRREREFLYPLLDRVTTEEERRALLERCRIEPS